MQILIVAPCLAPETEKAGCATPPQIAMHLAASTPVRHRVQIVDTANIVCSATASADLYVLVWSAEFSPVLVELAVQLATCDPLVCVWDGAATAPVEYLLEFFDQIVCPTQSIDWQQFLTTIEGEQCQLI
ncbi:MAG: hypothetical protein R3E79_09890 [Caldilineaceae bacterium]